MIRNIVIGACVPIFALAGAYVWCAFDALFGIDQPSSGQLLFVFVVSCVFAAMALRSS
jgi:hypothetical protein